ncbi:hypothetical protein PGTUg99_011191 [Puccinia graminis f. sp. tritici]|uniref:Uncharacterized protein n=1 Tax=Puccinia graminis f. sp. tritici TaxID=56615 RepID=A0A5B0S9J6_PUCGR|nr:hypothetical protein PGTUg99_011191 [Puccinia graminis f. sp. tritici]
MDNTVPAAEEVTKGSSYDLYAAMEEHIIRNSLQPLGCRIGCRPSSSQLRALTCEVSSALKSGLAEENDSDGIPKATDIQGTSLGKLNRFPREDV